MLYFKLWGLAAATDYCYHNKPETRLQEILCCLSSRNLVIWKAECCLRSEEEIHLRLRTSNGIQGGTANACMHAWKMGDLQVPTKKKVLLSNPLKGHVKVDPLS
jgi:hypothetical protein